MTFDMTAVGASESKISSLFQRGWPLASLTLALGMDLAWIAFLGYGLVKLALRAL
jgi:hypothetical protein